MLTFLHFIFQINKIRTIQVSSIHSSIIQTRFKQIKCQVMYNVGMPPYYYKRSQTFHNN